MSETECTKVASPDEIKDDENESNIDEELVIGDEPKQESIFKIEKMIENDLTDAKRNDSDEVKESNNFEQTDNDEEKKSFNPNNNNDDDTDDIKNKPAKLESSEEINEQENQQLEFQKITSPDTDNPTSPDDKIEKKIDDVTEDKVVEDKNEKQTTENEKIDESNLAEDELNCSQNETDDKMNKTDLNENDEKTKDNNNEDIVDNVENIKDKLDNVNNDDDNDNIDRDECKNGKNEEKKENEPDKNLDTKSNVITEVVVPGNDEVTLDLSKTLVNGQINDKENHTNTTSELTTNGACTRSKRTRSNSLTLMAEDLSLPAKRRVHSTNEQMNDTNARKKEDLRILSNHNENNKNNQNEIDYNEKESMDNGINEEDDKYTQQKLIRKLKEQLFNEEMKLVFLKKIRQNQLKENISHQQINSNSTNNSNNNITNNSNANNNHTHHNNNTNHYLQHQNLMNNNINSNNQHSHHHRYQTGTSGVNSNFNSSGHHSSPANAAAVGMFANSLRETFTNILTNNHYPSLTSTGLNSVLNFSMNAAAAVAAQNNNNAINNSTNNMKNQPNLINNNAAHSNNHSSSVLGKNYSNLMNFSSNQMPMQAHMSKTSSTKNNSNLNPPFVGHNIGRSPYNYINNPLTAPPPPSSIHGNTSGSSSKRGGHDSHNLNSSYTSNKSMNRAISQASSPNLAHSNYSDLRHSSSKHNQMGQNAPSISPSTNQVDIKTDPILLQKQYKQQAMRKQLEKIPQPKVIPSEMHFIPNPSNPEFIYYVGLETVVNYLTTNNQSPQPPEPFECVQCGTDFTPVWKWKDRSNPNKPSVICEKCVNDNMKKLICDDYNKEVNNYSKLYEQFEKQLAAAAAAAAANPPPPPPPPSNAISPSLSSNPSNAPLPARQSNPIPNNIFGTNNPSVNPTNFNLPQAHSNSPLSSLTNSQMATMAAFLMPQANNNQTSVSTPPAAHSSSSRSSSSSNTNFNPANLAAAFGSPNSPQAAALALALQQFQSPKINPAQLMMAQQLLAASSNPTAANSAVSANALSQLMSFPNFFYSTLLAASLQKSSAASTPQSPLNAAAAGLPRQLLMDMLPNFANLSGTSGSPGGHHSRSNQSMPQHWKS